MTNEVLIPVVNAVQIEAANGSPLDVRQKIIHEDYWPVNPDAEFEDFVLPYTDDLSPNQYRQFLKQSHPDQLSRIRRSYAEQLENTDNEASSYRIRNLLASCSAYAKLYDFEQFFRGPKQKGSLHLPNAGKSDWYLSGLTGERTIKAVPYLFSRYIGIRALDELPPLTPEAAKSQPGHEISKVIGRVVLVKYKYNLDASSDLYFEKLDPAYRPTEAIAA